jgi:hypothetical protein
MITYCIFVWIFGRCICVPQPPNSFPCSPFVLLHLQHLFWNLFNVCFYHQQVFKPPLLTYTLESISNFDATWIIMFTISFEIFNSFDFVKWDLSWYSLEITLIWDPNTKWVLTSFHRLQPLRNFRKHMKYISSTFIQKKFFIYYGNKKILLPKKIVL